MRPSEEDPNVVRPRVFDTAAGEPAPLVEGKTAPYREPLLALLWVVMLTATSVAPAVVWAAWRALL